MPFPLLLLAIGAGAAALARSAGGGKLPPHQQPFYSFPPGFDGAEPIALPDFLGSSGHSYKVTGFNAADGRTYYVAEKRGDIDWVSYVVLSNGQRQRWAVNADQHAEIEQMLADFQLPGAVT